MAIHNRSRWTNNLSNSTQSSCHGVRRGSSGYKSVRASALWIAILLLTSNTGAVFGASFASWDTESPEKVDQANNPESTSSLSNPASGSEIQFNRDIRPILTENCFSCHGQDPHSRGADLRLDDRDSALAGGAIVPNSADESSLWKRIISEDADEVMPPVDSHKVLNAHQKALIRQWINEGAVYQGHWAFEAPVKPELPSVRNLNWVRNPLDRFVLAELERRGLEPAPEADLRSLLRRVTFDLTGLPPTAEDVKRVLENPSPDRYEQYVDELLERPDWGEHRARYWLDYARYADTHGIHFDNYREVWAFRDWVIRAYNDNLPFDQFSLEQLAGDLLPEATLDQKIATGFNRCNITTNEGGAISEEYQVLYTRDRVETTGLVWLGLTVGCAVCHDHKFDPISQKEFYQLAAFFNNTTQSAMDGNIKDTPPTIHVPRLDERETAQKLLEEIRGVESKKAARREIAQPEFFQYVASEAAKPTARWALADPVLPVTHIPFNGMSTRSLDTLHEGFYRQISLEPEGTVVPGHISANAWKIDKSYPAFPIGDFERDQAFSVSLWVNPTDRANGSLVARMDEQGGHRGWDVWLEGGAIGMHVISNWPDNAIKAVSKSPLPAGKWTHVAISYDGSSKVEGLKIYVDGREAERNVQRNSLTDTIRTEQLLTIGRRSTGGANAANSSLQDLRIYSQVLAPDVIKGLHQGARSQYLLAKSDRSPEETEELYQFYLATVDPESVQLVSDLAKLKGEYDAIYKRGTFAHVMNEAKTDAIAFVLERGDYDKRAEQVAPGTPAAFRGMPEELPKNRLGFAKWLFLPDHPLTARVTVNRFWQELFGQGIVGSAGDFGITGQLPSNPELLDYLAVQFREDGWNIKNYYKSLVTSATYRQSASVSPERFSLDPDNKWMSRGPRFRMDAEMIRDTALYVSELLVQKIGGPSVYPYQPPGVWEAVAMPESNTRFYPQSQGESLYRRSMYTFLKRAAPPPSMEVFNATAREVCTIRRERTNTPLQALVTLNDPQYVEAARLLATRLLLDESLEKEAVARIQWLGDRLISRPFRPEELQVIQQSLLDLSSHYEANLEQANALLLVGDTRSDASLPVSELAAWTMLCNQLMNLDEVITK